MRYVLAPIRNYSIEISNPIRRVSIRQEHNRSFDLTRYSQRFRHESDTANMPPVKIPMGKVTTDTYTAENSFLLPMWYSGMEESRENVLEQKMVSCPT